MDILLTFWKVFIMIPLNYWYFLNYEIDVGGIKMINVSGGILFITLLFIIIGLFTVILLRGIGVDCSNSKSILTKIESDNRVPEISDLIEYHKLREPIRYKIKSSDN